MKIENEVSLEALELDHRFISFEVFNGLQGLANAIKRLPTMMGTALNIFNRQREIGLVGLIDRSKMDKSWAYVQKLNYAEIRNNLVIVPEGLQADLLSYTNALRKVADTVMTLESDVIIPYERWLAEMVGEPERIRNLTNNAKIPGMRNLDFMAGEREIQQLFATTGQRHHEVPFGQAFHRIADYQTVIRVAEDLDRVFSQSTQKRLMIRIERVNELLSELVKIIDLNVSGTRPSPATIRSLAETAMNVARLLEQYGLYRYRLLALEHALEKTSERVRTF